MSALSTESSLNSRIAANAPHASYRYRNHVPYIVQVCVELGSRKGTSAAAKKEPGRPHSLPVKTCFDKVVDPRLPPTLTKHIDARQAKLHAPSKKRATKADTSVDSPLQRENKVATHGKDKAHASCLPLPWKSSPDSPATPHNGLASTHRSPSPSLKSLVIRSDTYPHNGLSSSPASSSSSFEASRTCSGPLPLLLLPPAVTSGT